MESEYLINSCSSKYLNTNIERLNKTLSQKYKTELIIFDKKDRRQDKKNMNLGILRIHLKNKLIISIAQHKYAYSNLKNEFEIAIFRNDRIVYDTPYKNECDIFPYCELKELYKIINDCDKIHIYKTLDILDNLNKNHSQGSLKSF